MTTTNSPTEKFEQDALLAGEVAVGALRAVEVAAVVLLGLLVCPPLAILAVLVVVPLFVAASVVGLVIAVLSAPYLLVHHFRNPHAGHLSLLAHRLRRAGRAILDLAPHRIVSHSRSEARSSSKRAIASR
jgi:hypothetical protein